MHLDSVGLRELQREPHELPRGDTLAADDDAGGLRVGELQEAGILPGAAARAYDITALVPPTSWWGVLLAGIFNVTAEPTWAQVASWIVYAAVVGVLFVRRQRPRATSELPARRARAIESVPVDAARRPA